MYFDWQKFCHFESGKITKMSTRGSIAVEIGNSHWKLDVGMVENATVGSAKYISRKLGF